MSRREGEHRQAAHRVRMTGYLASLSGLAISLTCACFVSAAEIAPGVSYTLYNAPGPNRVHVVAADRLRSEYKFSVGFAQKRRNYAARESVSTIAARYDDSSANHDVLAAVNGSFFDPVNLPRLLGVNQTGGEMLDTPAFNGAFQYHTMLMGPERRPRVVSNFAPALGTLTFPDGYTMILHQYNFNMAGPLTPTNNSTFVFTPGFDAVTPCDFTGYESWAAEIQLSDVTYPMRSHKEVSGIVTAINSPTSGHTPIPEGGMVLSTLGTFTKPNMLAHVQVGDRLRMRFVTGSDDLNNSDMAITGIGWIIHDGAAYPAGWANLESGAAPNSRHPRTVMAWNQTHLFMVVCDGRSGVSVGMTFQEMSDFLTGTLNATEAINLDGGGSSTMVVDGTVMNTPSDGAQRAVANAVMLVKESTATEFPFTDSFGPGGRLPGWDDKFEYAAVVPFEPPSPAGDGHVLKVAPGFTAVNTARRGDFGDTDYSVEADLYCDYRPGLAADGYERIALFARDSGTGALGLSTWGGGNCYAMLYDSHTGAVRAGKYVNGSFVDFIPPGSVSVTASGWRRFRIDCYGSKIGYRLDESLVAQVTDDTFARGFFGVGCHEFFITNTNVRGARADNLEAFIDASFYPARGDYDEDGDVDMDDFGHFQTCLTGNGNPQPDLACAGARLDLDSDVDSVDLSLFLACFNGPNTPPPEGCQGP